MRMSTQPTCPAELRTRYQSSITALGGSASFALSPRGFEADAVVAVFSDAAASVAGAVGLAVFGSVVFACGLIAAPCFCAGGGLGAFLSVVARFRISTLWPSFS